MYISEGFEKFRENIMKQTNQDVLTQNVYLIQTEDMDGNITDEKYGVNLRTDPGMCASSNDYAIIYLGSGTRPATYHDMTTENRNTKFDAYLSSLNDSWSWKYNLDTKMISSTTRTYSVIYDYNISGVTTDQVFTEIGIVEYSGGNTYGVSTRTLIYDNQGQVSSITKHLNEKLTIYIYRSFSIHEDVILNAYNSGTYILINMNDCRMIQSSGRPYVPDSGIHFFSSRYVSDRYSYYSASAKEVFTDDSDPGVNTSNYTSTCESGTNSGNVITNTSFYFDKCGTWATNFMMIKKIFMNTPESVEFNQVYTDDNTSPSYIKSLGFKESDNDTRYGIIPVTDFNLTSSTMFNNKSGEFDIVNDFDTGRVSLVQWYGGYDIGSLCISLPVIDPILHSQYTYYVGINMDNNVPIDYISISNYGSNQRFYLADKYWDTSTWIYLSSYSDPGDGRRYFRNIPEEAKYCRYFIARDMNPNNIHIYRNYDHYPRLTNSFTPYQLENVPTFDYSTFGSGYTAYAFIPIVSETYKWMLLEDHVISMNNDGTIAYSHQLYAGPSNLDGLTDAHCIDTVYVRAGFDNKLVVGSTRVGSTYESTPRNIRIYDMTTMTSSDPPSYTDFHIASSTYSNSVYFTKSSNGFVAIWISSDSHSVSYIINVNTEEMVSVQNTRWFHIQDFTNYAIYAVVGSDPIQFNVYDLNSNTIVDTFTIDGYVAGNLYSVCGCGNYFYMQFGSNADHLVYMYNLDTQTVGLNDGMKLYLNSYGGGIGYPFNYPQEGWNNKRCYHRDGMIINGTDGIARKTAFTGHYANPSRSVRLINGNDYRSIIGFLSHIVENVIDNDHTQLLLLDTINCYSSYVYESNRSIYRQTILDIGYAFKKGATLRFPYQHWNEHYVGPGRDGGLALYNGKLYSFDTYNGFVYPLAPSIMHKVEGETYNYQQINNPKNYNFSGSYRVHLTNHGDITSLPSPPVTFNVSGTPDGSGQNVRFKSWWCWYVGDGSYFKLNTYNWARTRIGLSKFFRVNPGDKVTVNATFKNDVDPDNKIDHLVTEIYVTEDLARIKPEVAGNSSYDDNRYAVKHTIREPVGTAITIPTGSYSTQYLRIYMNIYAVNSSNYELPIASTFLDTYSISVTQ